MDRFEVMRKEVPYFWYLEERGWFMRDFSLQTLLWDVVRSGLSHKVQVTRSDFKNHLADLMENEEKKDCKSE